MANQIIIPERQEIEPHFYLGTCDTCGAAIAYKQTEIGGIDIGITETGHAYAWIRHYATAPSNANPDCARYFSRVYSLDTPPGLLEAMTNK